MAYETLKKRLNKCDVIAHQPLTLAYLIQRADLEESGEYVAYDPRITDELLVPLMVKAGQKSPRRATRGKNSSKIRGDNKEHSY